MIPDIIQMVWFIYQFQQLLCSILIVKIHFFLVTSLVFEVSQRGMPLLDNVYVCIFFIILSSLHTAWGFSRIGRGSKLEPKNSPLWVQTIDRPLPSESRLRLRLHWELGSNRPTQELIEQILDIWLPVIFSCYFNWLNHLNKWLGTNVSESNDNLS